MKTNGFGLVIYALENTSNSDKPTATVTVEVGEKGNILQKTITVNQKGKEDEPDPETTHISKDGGTVKFEDLRIIVPDGGFQKDADVKVEKVESDMGEYAASQYYKVTLPADFTKEMTLKLEPNFDETNAPDIFARMSTDSWAVSLDAEATSSNMIQATKDGSSYSAVIEPFGNDENKGETIELTVGLVKGYSSIGTS